MMHRKIDSLGHDQVRIFDYRMFSVMVIIGSMSALGLAYTLNQSCVAESQTPQTDLIHQGISSPVSGVGVRPSIMQQPQKFVFRYSDGSQKVVDIPSNAKEAEIRDGIMLRHNTAKQGI